MSIPLPTGMLLLAHPSVRLPVKPAARATQESHHALLLNALVHNVRQHHDSATATTVLVSLALASQLDIQPLTAKATLGRAAQHGTDSLPPSVMPATKASEPKFQRRKVV